MKENEKPGRYFKDALSDFVYDAASGRAIRHLTDSGYTAAQISELLAYPTPFHKIQHTVTRHLKESGILLEELPVAHACFHPVCLHRTSPERLFSLLAQYLSLNGEENSYVLYPAGTDAQALSMLTAREREYLNGILWESGTMYHRLNRRMLEIGAQTALYSDHIRFYFIKTRDVLIPS